MSSTTMHRSHRAVRSGDRPLDALEGRVFLSVAGHGNGPAEPPGRPIESLVYAPTEKIRGATLGQWGDVWWKWAFNSTDDDYRYGQQVGKVFFLTGMVGETAEVTVPSGTPIVFPIWNNEWSDLEGFGDTFEEIAPWNDAILDELSSISVSIDGVEVPDAASYRAGSTELQETVAPADTFWFPIDEPTPVVFVQEGYWMALRPLSPGEHTIHFDWTADFEEGDVLSPGDDPWVVGPGGMHWEADITLELTVVPQGKYVGLLPPLSGRAFSAGAKTIAGELFGEADGVLK